jgi:hypothetical protein
MTDAPDRAPSRDVERYEQLRRQALAGEPSGWRLGLALLERRGVAAWSRAWRGAAPAREPQPAGEPVAELPAASGELVGALARMALASVAAG